MCLIEPMKDQTGTLKHQRWASGVKGGGENIGARDAAQQQELMVGLSQPGQGGIRFSLTLPSAGRIKMKDSFMQLVFITFLVQLVFITFSESPFVTIPSKFCFPIHNTLHSNFQLWYLSCNIHCNRTCTIFYLFYLSISLSTIYVKHLF